MPVSHDRAVPWKYGRQDLAPVGLREKVLRIAYLPPLEVRRIRRESRYLGLRTVATWRLEHPKEWAELCQVLGIGFDERPSMQGRRKPMRHRDSGSGCTDADEPNGGDAHA